MKKLVLGLILLSCTAFSATIEEANQLYSDRSLDASGVTKAQDAADMYGVLASEEENMVTKGKLLTAQSRAMYFVGSHTLGDDNKATFHNKGKKLAKEAMSLLSGNNELAAAATYQFGANLGKWGEAKGITTSLGQWPTLKDNMKSIIKTLKQPQTEFYGAHRILGRAYFKIPKLLGGSKKKSKKYLELAVKKTLLEGTSISIYPTNNTYLAETWMKVKYKTKAKQLLIEFITYVETNGHEAYNADLVPETMDEIVVAKKLLQEL